MFLILLVPFFTLVFCEDDPFIDVEIHTSTNRAVIRGYDHAYGRSWRGIPFAVPPIGESRFKYAQRLDPCGFIPALEYGPMCTQKRLDGGSEDCLTLNIFAPKNASLTDKLPVYVYIHGGGFFAYDSKLQLGIFPNLVNRGPLILVTVQYRLGPFGFFSTRESTAPGNFAVSDWIEALHWVQRYISFFGGDPRRVTLGGQSSGAEATSLLSLTKKADGLYSQLILESGSAFSAAVMSYSEENRNTSRMLAANTVCTTIAEWNSGKNFEKIVSCLRNLTTEQLASVDYDLPKHRMKWAPVADETFFPMRLEYLALLRKPVPVMLGVVHDEYFGWGALDVPRPNPPLFNYTERLYSAENTLNGVKNHLASSYEMLYWDNKDAVLEGAFNEYVNNQPFDENDLVNWMAKTEEIFTDLVFIGPTLREAKYFATTNSDVYLYSFDYLNSLAYPYIKEEPIRGVPHSTEMLYIYDSYCAGYVCTKEDARLREYMSQMWTNFIVTGNPTPTGGDLPFVWSKFDKSDRYLKITPSPKTAYGFHPDSTFWACTAPTLDGYKPPMC